VSISSNKYLNAVSNVFDQHVMNLSPGLEIEAYLLSSFVIRGIIDNIGKILVVVPFDLSGNGPFGWSANVTGFPENDCEFPITSSDDIAAGSSLFFLDV